MVTAHLVVEGILVQGKDLETAFAGLTQRASEHDLCKALCRESIWFHPVACKGERDERDGGPGHPRQEGASRE